MSEQISTEEVPMVIFRSPKSHEEWAPVLFEEVPDELKTNMCITELKEGRFCGVGQHWYRGQVIDVE